MAEKFVAVETPNFEQVAARLLRLTIDNFDPRWNATMRECTEQLRQVWNARGAADIAKLDAELSMLIGATMAGPYVKNLDRALRTLDR
jgi:aspartate aminotransferase-like enzyme